MKPFVKKKKLCVWCCTKHTDSEMVYSDKCVICVYLTSFKVRRLMVVCICEWQRVFSAVWGTRWALYIQLHCARHPSGWPPKSIHPAPHRCPHTHTHPDIPHTLQPPEEDNLHGYTSVSAAMEMWHLCGSPFSPTECEWSVLCNMMQAGNNTYCNICSGIGDTGQ